MLDQICLILVDEICCLLKISQWLEVRQPDLVGRARGPAENHVSNIYSYSPAPEEGWATALLHGFISLYTDII